MRRIPLVLGTLFVLAAPAFAQPVPLPRKAVKRPMATLGNAKEEDEPAAPMAPALSGCSERDTAFARAVAYAFEPAPVEIRVIAIEDLALLGDARALNPLAQLVFDAQPQVQSAALRAVSRFAAPRAEEILSNVLRHPLLPERLKLLAVEGLVFQRAPSAREMLASVVDAAGYTATLRASARQALEDWGPKP